MIEIGIKRPITTLMLAISILFFSILILPKIPIDLYPNYEYGEVSVISHLRGGVPASEVEKYVTRPMEDVFSEVNGVKEMISASREAESVIVLRFYPGVNLDFAILEIREKLATIRHRLPREMERPVIAKFQQNDVPIMIISLASQEYTPEQLREFVEDVFKERLLKISGVANIEIGGGRERKILIEFDNSKLVAYNLPILEVISKINLTNISVSAGEVEHKGNKFVVRATGEYKSLDEIRQTAVAVTPSGSIVYLGDIAEVKDSYYEPSSFARLNLSPIVSVYIQKEKSANTLQVAKNIEKEIKELQGLYKNIVFTIVKNDADYIRKSINSLWFSLFFSAILVAVVLVLFLRNLTSVFIVVLTIPISLGVAIILMYISKLTFNIMTLSGLGLGVGMIVDNGIIILENISQHFLNSKKSKATIIVEATKELFMPIAASTLTTIIVFLPLVFLEPEVKRLYVPFGLAITYSLIASWLGSIIFVPWVSFFLFKTTFVEKPKWQEKLLTYFKNGVKFVFRNAKFMLPACIILIVLSFYLLSKRESEFIETTEINTFRIGVQFPPATRLERSDEIIKEIEKELLKYPQVERVSSRVEKLHTFIEVKVKKDVEFVKNDFRKKFDKFMPAFLYYQPSQEIASKEVFVDFYGYDYRILKQLAFLASGRLSQIPVLTDVKIRMREDEPEAIVYIDRNKLALAKMLSFYFANTLHGQLRGLVATYYRTGGKELETVCRLIPGSVSKVEELNFLKFVSPYRDVLAVNQVSEIKKVDTQQEIWRKNKKRFIQISANRHKVGLSTAVKMMNNVLKTINFPKDYFYRFSGEYEDMVKNKRQFILALILTVFLVYITLAALFENYLQPFIIMFSIPTGLVGVSLLLLIFKKPISLGTWIGLMMLCGIVVNAVIVMVEKMNIYKRKSKENLKRVVLASPKTYLMEVLMTSITTILGILPLILNFDETAVLWRTLGLTMFGGMLFSTIISGFLTPLLYFILERKNV
jgi:HAE1 family hydrophobic/amphiphilic exporter-1